MPLIAIKFIKNKNKMGKELLDEIYNIWEIHKQCKSHFPDWNAWWKTSKWLLKECSRNLTIEIKKVRKCRDIKHALSFK